MNTIKKNKMVLIIGGIFLLYALLIFFLNKDFHPTKGYIIVSELGGFSCNQGKCIYESIEDINLEGKKIKTYQQNKLVGTYELKHLNRWNFMENNSWKNLYGDFLGVEETLNVEIKEYNTESMNNEDRKKINEFLKNHNISGYKKLNSEEVITVDLDSNNEIDRIIAITNQTEEEVEETYFTLLGVILNGKLQEIYFDSGENAFTLPYYNVFSVLNLDEEKKSRIIINKGYYDEMGSPSISMLEFDGKKILETAKGN